MRRYEEAGRVVRVYCLHFRFLVDPVLWTENGTDVTYCLLKAQSVVVSPSGPTITQVRCVSTLTGCIMVMSCYTLDPLHTYLGLCGLSLNGEKNLKPVHAALNISQRAAQQLNTPSSRA